MNDNIKEIRLPIAEEKRISLIKDIDDLLYSEYSEMCVDRMENISFDFFQIDGESKPEVIRSMMVRFFHARFIYHKLMEYIKTTNDIKLLERIKSLQEMGFSAIEYILQYHCYNNEERKFNYGDIEPLDQNFDSYINEFKKVRESEFIEKLLTGVMPIDEFEEISEEYCFDVATRTMMVLGIEGPFFVSDAFIVDRGDGQIFFTGAEHRYISFNPVAIEGAYEIEKNSLIESYRDFIGENNHGIAIGVYDSDEDGVEMIRAYFFGEDQEITGFDQIEKRPFH